jgi:hypothetical protein
MVNVLPHNRHSPRRTQTQFCCSSSADLRRCPCPMIDARWHSGHQRGICCKSIRVTPEPSCHLLAVVRFCPGQFPLVGAPQDSRTASGFVVALPAASACQSIFFKIWLSRGRVLLVRSAGVIAEKEGARFGYERPTKKRTAV